MSYGSMEAPKPRNGHTLIVGIVARISGCPGQKELSLDDQIDHVKAVVSELYQGPVEYRTIRTKGKGERLDREELEQIQVLLKSEELDLLVMEDMGRLVRGGEAVRLFGVGVDHGTRCISPNDSVDTIEPTWEEDALAACRDHVAHNAHTSKRIKQKLMNRFTKLGAAISRTIAGYIVPPGTKMYNDWSIDVDATPIVVEGLRLLKETKNCEAVAEYFNGVSYKGGIGFPTGPYCRRRLRDKTLKKTTFWNGKMVRRFYKNRLLGGAPGRGFKHTIKIHETGRRVSVNNPDGPKFIECAHLAHVELAELDAVNVVLAERNANAGRKKVNGVDPQTRVSRKDSRFPGYCSTCWYCGRPDVWGGNGIPEHLMCTGAREWRCWCSIGFDGALATERILGGIFKELDLLTGIEAQLRELVERAMVGRGDLRQRQDRLRQTEEALAVKKRNVMDTIAVCGALPIVKQMLAEIGAEETNLKSERRELEAQAKRKLEVPQSISELREILQVKFHELVDGTRAFNHLLRKLVPEFHVYVVRLCDGGHLLPRAKVTLALDAVVPDALHVPGFGQILRCNLTIDLFDPPPREKIRQDAVALIAQGLDQRQIARELKVTQAAVQKSLALDRKMQAMGLDNPYVLVSEPPNDYPKLRRHKNSKYRLDPLEGYQRPPL